MRTGTACDHGALSQGRAPLFFCEKQTAQYLFSALRSIGRAPMWCNGSADFALDDAAKWVWMLMLKHRFQT
jgi:hypothetical protein